MYITKGKLFSQYVDFSFLEICQFRVNIITFENFSSTQKSSSEEVVCSFDSPAENFSLKVRVNKCVTDLYTRKTTATNV